MTYSREFYVRTSRAAQASAQRIVPLLAQALRPESVLDVGAGGGGWLAAWSRNGVGDVLALDGASPADCGYTLPASTFRTIDLTRPFDLGRRFALVQSLEVAEHLPPASAESFIGSLAKHGDIVLFSAAPPGQGGMHHLNERDYEYWRGCFKAHGFQPVDWLRPRIANDLSIAWWYRYNILLYIRRNAVNRLSSDVQRAAIAEEARIKDIAPLRHQIRRVLLRHVPPAFVTRMAHTAESLLKLGSR